MFPTITDTAANWLSKNPVLNRGQIGLESGPPVKSKIGNGQTPWSLLPYTAYDPSGNSNITALVNAAVSAALVSYVPGYGA